jgi:glycosyltransferase involved in cell wall biosynthesis
MLAMLNLPQEPTRRFVTIVANIQNAVKDHWTFLRAAARVHKAVPEAAFVIAGEGVLIDELRALAVELGIQSDTFFTGRCQRVAELLSISNVCALSSKAEGFSNAILEYMAAARPVVVTDVGGAREAVIEGETGFLVQPGDDEGMAARIIVLLRDSERARVMGLRGRSIIEERFSCETQLERTQDIYERLLAGSRAAARPKVVDVVRESA